MSQYYNLKIKEIIKETEDAITIVFEQPRKEKIDYKPGQFLTLILTINGEKIRRSYSLCTSPDLDENPAITVKSVINGKVSNYLTGNVKSGDIIEVMQPMGTFTLDVNSKNNRTIVLIGAGSGITPLMGIAKTILINEPSSSVYLLYGNRNESSIIFKDKIAELNYNYGSRFSFIHVLSQPSDAWTFHKGRLNQSEIIKLLELYPELDFKKAEYFICGPEGMMDEAQKALGILKVPIEMIKRESFVSSTNALPSGEVEVDDANQAGPLEVTIIYQGTEYKVTVPPSKSILESALDANIDLPYSCQSGMCTACMGKCTSGKVYLDHPDGLSDKEIDQGYVLTCVGHPVSGDVVIEIG